MSSPVQARMDAHFALAADLRTLTVEGDLGRLRIIAEELATLEETWGMPPGSESYLEALRDAARRAADARNLVEAVRATSEVAVSCGACHLAHEVNPGAAFAVPAPRLTDPGTRHADYLSWVSRLLWSGLTGPSDRMWRLGAGAISTVDAIPAPHARHVPTTEVTRATDALSRLGVDAVTAEDPSGRARILADIWTTCTDCHANAGVGR